MMRSKQNTLVLAATPEKEFVTWSIYSVWTALFSLRNMYGLTPVFKLNMLPYILKELGLWQQDEEKILWKNAARLFKIL